MAEHRMIPGSHERSDGAQCVCGDDWSRWESLCFTQHMEKYPERYPASAAKDGE